MRPQIRLRGKKSSQSEEKAERGFKKGTRGRRPSTGEPKGRSIVLLRGGVGREGKKEKGMGRRKALFYCQRKKAALNYFVNKGKRKQSSKDSRVDPPVPQYNGRKRKRTTQLIMKKEEGKEGKNIGKEKRAGRFCRKETVGSNNVAMLRLANGEGGRTQGGANLESRRDKKVRLTINPEEEKR